MGLGSSESYRPTPHLVTLHVPVTQRTPYSTSGDPDSSSSSPPQYAPEEKNTQPPPNCSSGDLPSLHFGELQRYEDIWQPRLPQRTLSRGLWWALSFLLSPSSSYPFGTPLRREHAAPVYSVCLSRIQAPLQPMGPASASPYPGCTR